MSAGAAKLCLGCRKLGRWGRSGRCDECKLIQQRNRERNPRRRAIKRSRYNHGHRRTRLAWSFQVDSGCVNCARCGEWIDPGTAWDLDHMPDGTSRPSHAACNRAAITRSTNTKENMQ